MCIVIYLQRFSLESRFNQFTAGLYRTCIHWLFLHMCLFIINVEITYVRSAHNIYNKSDTQRKRVGSGEDADREFETSQT